MSQGVEDILIRVYPRKESEQTEQFQGMARGAPEKECSPQATGRLPKKMFPGMQIEGILAVTPSVYSFMGQEPGCARVGGIYIPPEPLFHAATFFQGFSPSPQGAFSCSLFLEKAIFLPFLRVFYIVSDPLFPMLWRFHAEPQALGGELSQAFQR